MQTKKEKRLRRHNRVRVKVSGTKDRPRFSVFRSSKHILAQLIDDEEGKTLLAVSDKNLAAGNKSQTKSDKSYAVGKMMAERAQEKKVKKVVFDRGGYVFTGRVKKLAEGARDGGLEF